MRFAVVLPVAAAFLISIPALAGEDHRCEHEVTDCLTAMVDELKSSGFIGVEIDGEKETDGIYVSEVIPDSPAESAGIQPGDVLLSLNGVPFRKESHERMQEVKLPGKEVTVTLQRDGESQSIQLTLVPMPADLMAKYIGQHMMAHAEQEQMKIAEQSEAEADAPSDG